MKYIFIINPIAGSANVAQGFREDIAKLCAARSIECVFETTEYKGHATNIARAWAQKGEPVRIFALGGDGTLSETANGIVGFDNVELGCIPCGSGNDYIKTYGDISHFHNLEEYIFSQTIPIDVIRTGDKYCINISSLGLDAIICNRADEYIRKGKYSGSKAYDIATARSILGQRTNDLHIQIDDGEEFEGKFLFSVAANGVCYGGGYYSAPMADPADGLLDFVLVRNIPLLRIPFMVGAYKAGTYINDKRFRKIAIHRRGKKMVVRSKKPAIVNVDGECEVKSETAFEIVPAALRFVVPAEYLASRK